MNTLLAIDPSLTATGVAHFTTDVTGMMVLDRASLASAPAADSLALRCDMMVKSVRKESYHHSLAIAHYVVIEKPRIHVATRGGKADPADIIKLAILCGALAQHYIETGAEVIFVEPAEWKGQTPKDITTERSKAALTDREQQRVVLPGAKSLAHNVWDAVGIGLWFARRT